MGHGRVVTRKWSDCDLAGEIDVLQPETLIVRFLFATSYDDERGEPGGKGVQ